MIEFRVIDKMSGWLLISPLIAMIICHFQRSPWMEEGKWTSAIICPSGIALDPDSSPYVRLWGLRQSPAPVEVIWCFVACSDHPGINWNVSFESFDPRRCLFYPILQVLFLGANMWKNKRYKHRLPCPFSTTIGGTAGGGTSSTILWALQCCSPKKRYRQPLSTPKPPSATTWGGDSFAQEGAKKEPPQIPDLYQHVQTFIYHLWSARETQVVAPTGSHFIGIFETAPSIHYWVTLNSCVKKYKQCITKVASIDWNIFILSKWLTCRSESSEDGAPNNVRSPPHNGCSMLDVFGRTYLRHVFRAGLESRRPGSL